jgi:putative transposase
MKRAMTRKRHRPEEVVAKLREVDEALSQGKILEDVAKLLSMSLMTLHRWQTK